MTVGALVRFRDRRAGFGLGPLENRFASFLGRREVAVRETIAIRTIRKRVNECDKVGELLLCETLRPEEKLLGARTTFGRHVGIATVPFEWLGSGEVFKGAVVDDVFAETVRFQIPLQSVDGGVDVAVGAAELTLEGEISRIEEALATAESADISRSTKINGGSDRVGLGVDDRDCVVETIRNVEPIAIRRKCHAARIVADGDASHNVFRRG